MSHTPTHDCKKMPAPLHAECNHSKPQHTPTPWHTASDESGYFRCIEKDDRLIARVPSSDSLKSEKDAAFIVRAVNFHQVLLNIAKNLDYGRHGKFDSGCEVCQTIREAEAL